MKNKTMRDNQGFTIVELMIALSVLSILLVMATVIMIRISGIYTKGVNTANLQNANRNVLSDVAAAMQFSGVDPTTCGGFCTDMAGTYRAVCVGNVRYSYILNRTLGRDGFTGAVTPHVLWRDTLNVNGDTANCKPLNLTLPAPSDSLSNGDGEEMVPNHVRLSRFDITQPADDAFSATIWMAYGDDDFVIPTPLSCRGDKGTEYCAISKLSTTVIRRVQ